MSIYTNGEKTRLKQSIERMRAMMDSLETSLNLPHDLPFGTEVAQSILNQAGLVAVQIAKHDAYLRVEGDQKKE